MYFESNENEYVITQKPVQELIIAELMDSLPALDYQIQRNNNNARGTDMNFDKNYSTYHSENNCRDWMLTD